MVLNEKLNKTYTYFTLRNDSALKLYQDMSRLQIKNLLTPDKLHVSMTVSDCCHKSIRPYMYTGQSFRIDVGSFKILNGCLVLYVYSDILSNIHKEREKEGFKSVYENPIFHITLSYDPGFTDENSEEFLRLNRNISSDFRTIYLDAEHANQTFQKSKKPMNESLNKISQILEKKELDKNPCWKGYRKVKGKKDYEPGSCTKINEEEMKKMKLSGKKEQIEFHPKIRKIQQRPIYQSMLGTKTYRP